MTNQPKPIIPKKLQPHGIRSELPRIKSAPPTLESTESQTPLERYQRISHEMARTIDVKKQIEARERELGIALTLARNACIMAGIENPAAEPKPAEFDQTTEGSEQADFTIIHRRSVI